MFHHVLPRTYGDEGAYETSKNSTYISNETSSNTKVDESSESEDSYKSDNIEINIKKVSNSNVTYYVQDIKIKNIECLKTAFAGGEYAKSVSDEAVNIAKENNAILAINGDYYGIHDSGIVIRNGKVYRDVSDNENDICVLYYDGTMKTYKTNEFNISEATSNGAYQAWSFGPALLNDDGSAVTNFSRNRISQNNPRTAIGYYEAGHYCFVTVDGRGENNSQGMTLKELAALFEELGCKQAYNLDGGKSSEMVFKGSVYNSPSDGGREISDIIYIGEVEGKGSEK